MRSIPAILFATFLAVMVGRAVADPDTQQVPAKEGSEVQGSAVDDAARGDDVAVPPADAVPDVDVPDADEPEEVEVAPATR